VPPGTFLTGGLVLQSRITLHLEAGSMLLGSPHLQDYAYHAGPPEVADANGRHLIYARDGNEIEVSGLGVIDGGGPAFWARRERPPLPPDWGWRDVIANNWQPATNSRPSPMLEFACCTNVRIKDVTLQNPAGWTMRAVASKSVFITGLRVRNPVYAPNTDGMDVCCCENVFISNCDIDAGDDAICLKSENPYGPLLPTRNIVITNCILTTSSNGFKMGTATNGAFENIVFSNSVIYNNDVPWEYRVIAGIAVEMVDGGSVNGVSISNIRMQNVRTPIFIRLGHRNKGPSTALKNVSISNIEATGALITSSITGMPDAPVEGITLSDIRIETDGGGPPDWGRPEVPEAAEGYPEAWMFGHLPAYGLYLRHARNIRLRNIEIIVEKQEGRAAVVCDDVEDLLMAGFEFGGPTEHNPVLDLKDCRRVFFQGSRAPHDTLLFLSVSGKRSAEIVLAGNDLTASKQVVSCIEGASADQVSVRS
jgi:hypothetical protein